MNWLWRFILHFIHSCEPKWNATSIQSVFCTELYWFGKFLKYGNSTFLSMEKLKLNSINECRTVESILLIKIWVWMKIIQSFFISKAAMLVWYRNDWIFIFVSAFFQLNLCKNMLNERNHRNSMPLVNSCWDRTHSFAWSMEKFELYFCFLHNDVATVKNCVSILVTKRYNLLIKQP